MVDKVVITEEENNPSVEEQAKGTRSSSQERQSRLQPEWFPEKFANAEELAKLMVHLKRKCQVNQKSQLRS